MYRFGYLMKLFAVAALCLAVAAGIAGCGDDKKKQAPSADTYQKDQGLGESKKTTVDSTQSFSAKERAVVDRIAEFGDATAKRDYKTLCRRMLSKSARNLGGNCVETLKKSGSAFKDFKITVTKVDVAADGKSATVTAMVVTDVDTKGTKQTIPMVKEKGQWRIAILGQ